MLWSEIDFKPSSRTVRQFAALWLIFFGGLAIWQTAAANRWQLGLGLAAIAVLGGVGGLLKPAWLRPIYVGWMVLAFPVGWAVSQTLLAILFFCLFTPLGLFLRLTGRDALQRNRLTVRATYWTPRPAVVDVARYFRPY